MRVAGDRAAFYGCRFMSFQDTLLDDTAGRHYYRGCYVQGGTDLVFGSGKALFDVRYVYSTCMIVDLHISYIFHFALSLRMCQSQHAYRSTTIILGC